MTAIEKLHQSYIILALDLQKNKAQLNHNESNSVHEPVIWKSGGAVWALSNLQAVWTACTRKACPKIDSQPSTVFWFKLTYIYVFFLVVGRNIIFALRYHQPSPEISYHFCSEDFLGIPSAIKTNQIRLDPKQMIRIPTDWWNPMVRKWCFWGFVRGCVHGTHSWQLLSLGSMLKAVYFQLETWVSNPNRLLSTTGGLRQQTTGGYTVCTWYPLASFPLTKWHV